MVCYANPRPYRKPANNLFSVQDYAITFLLGYERSSVLEGAVTRVPAGAPLGVSLIVQFYHRLFATPWPLFFLSGFPNHRVPWRKCLERKQRKSCSFFLEIRICITLEAEMEQLRSARRRRDRIEWNVKEEIVSSNETAILLICSSWRLTYRKRSSRRKAEQSVTGRSTFLATRS